MRASARRPLSAMRSSIDARCFRLGVVLPVGLPLGEQLVFVGERLSPALQQAGATVQERTAHLFEGGVFHALGQSRIDAKHGPQGRAGGGGTAEAHCAAETGAACVSRS